MRNKNSAERGAHNVDVLVARVLFFKEPCFSRTQGKRDRTRERERKEGKQREVERVRERVGHLKTGAMEEL